MADLIYNLFGHYEPIMYNGVPLQGIAGVNFEWIASVGIFCICLCTVFALTVKAVGSIFRK